MDVDNLREAYSPPDATSVLAFPPAAHKGSPNHIITNLNGSERATVLSSEISDDGDDDENLHQGPFFREPPNLEPDSLQPAYFYSPGTVSDDLETIAMSGQPRSLSNDTPETLPPRKRRRFTRTGTSASPQKQRDNHDADGVPVFTPSVEDFQDFGTLMRRIAPWGMQRGLLKVFPFSRSMIAGCLPSSVTLIFVKIIPPPAFLDLFPPSIYPAHLREISIKRPITQQFHGTGGVYRCVNIEKGRSYSWDDWLSVARGADDGKGDLSTASATSGS
ncbi:hypothetical protein HDU93_003863, partial [Gonapodya sp. JEL0774]